MRERQPLWETVLEIAGAVVVVALLVAFFSQYRA